MTIRLFNSPFHALASLLAVASLSSVVACASARPAALTSDQFAPDWRAHSRGLINEGPGRNLSTTSWLVSGIAPRGRYVLINRKGDAAELIDGYQFEVSGDAGREIHMILPQGYGVVEAIPAVDVPALKVVRQP